MNGTSSICEQPQVVHEIQKYKYRYQDPDNHEKCSRCGNVRYVAERTLEGPVCQNCCARDPTKREKCSQCHEVKRVAERTPEGPICIICYHKNNIGICKSCEKEKVIQALGLCYACYKRHQRNKTAIEILEQQYSVNPHTASL